MNFRVQRHPDRTSISFADDGEDVAQIVTVTFDNRYIVGLDDKALVIKAREAISEFAKQ